MIDILKKVSKATSDALPGSGRETSIYCIKDLKADAYDTPFFQATHIHATRAFKMEVNRADDRNPIYLYPEDFGLVYLGTFHTGTGEIKPENELIATGKQLKNKQETV